MTRQTDLAVSQCGGASERPGDGRRLGLVLGMLVLPMYVALGAPAVALPSAARALGVPFGATAWILAAWSLTSALAMPVAGRLLSRWSPFRLLLAGVAGLVGGSALTAAAPTLTVVIAGRLVGGAGAGTTVIAVFAVATALPGRERARALGIVAAASATASGCGTLLGGTVTAWLGWRAVLALPALALPLLLAALPSRRALLWKGADGPDGRGEPFDFLGAAVLSVLAGSMITLLQAHSVGLPAPVTCAVATAGVVAAVGLRWCVRRRPDGFVPRRVIAVRGFPALGVIGASVFAGYYGVLFLAPSLIERATGGGALEAGLLLAPAAVCSVPAGRLAGALADRLAGRQITAGLAGTTLAGVLVVAVFSGPAPVVVGTALTVCGFAGAQAVLVGLATDAVASRDRDTAQGLLNFMNALGGGIGPAVVAGLAGIVPVPASLAVLAALPLAGAVLSLLRRPGAGPPSRTPRSPREPETTTHRSPPR
ncbi:MFS transporter [Streptomyces parvulus]|uniref:MFS transporter n=1 Tax=Streptomyces parvulus TaxID=146923 RepID=UPI0034528109